MWDDSISLCVCVKGLHSSRDLTGREIFTSRVTSSKEYSVRLEDLCGLKVDVLYIGRQRSIYIFLSLY